MDDVTNVFEMKTGKFTPLSESQQVALNGEQQTAYVALTTAVSERDAANAEHEAAVDANRAAGEALHEARAVQAKAPRWSRIDEARLMMARSRPDILVKTPLTVADPAIGAAVVNAQHAQADCNRRLTAAGDRRRISNGAVNLAAQRWQKVTEKVITPEQLVRQHLANEVQLRRDRAEGRIPESAIPHLGSKVDEFAYFTRRHGRGTGGGRAFARGAYPPSMRSHTIKD